MYAHLSNNNYHQDSCVPKEGDTYEKTSSYYPGNNFAYVPQADLRDNNEQVPRDIKNKSTSIASLKEGASGRQLLGGSTAYSSADSRLRSYPNDWKYEQIVSLIDLVKYGWVWDGKNDHVSCFSCKGLKRNWKRGETAFGEHKRLYPKCSFINSLLKDMLESHASHSSDVDVDKAEWKNIDCVKAVLDTCAFPEAEVKDVYANLSSKGVKVTVEMLFDRLTGESTDIETDSVNNLVEEAPCVNSINALTNEETQNYETWKNRTTCQVCFDKIVRVLFLPCRHLICCQTCADSVKKCPLCRTHISATIKAFLD